MTDPRLRAELSPSDSRYRRWAYACTVVAIGAVLAAAALTVVVVRTDDVEGRRFEAAMNAVAAGVPDGVTLSGTIAHTVADGDDHVVGYVVNGFRGDQEVLCRAVLARENVECVDLPVSWLAVFADADWK